MVTSTQQGVIGDLAASHLDAAYNLARWLLGNESDATDAVQDAFVRAMRSADTSRHSIPRWAKARSRAFTS